MYDDYEIGFVWTEVIYNIIDRLSIKIKRKNYRQHDQRRIFWNAKTKPMPCLALSTIINTLIIIILYENTNLIRMDSACHSSVYQTNMWLWFGFSPSILSDSFKTIQLKNNLIYRLYVQPRCYIVKCLKFVYIYTYYTLTIYVDVFKLYSIFPNIKIGFFNLKIIRYYNSIIYFSE